MKTYINTRTTEYPVFEHEIRRRYPTYSWAAVFTPPAEYAEVVDLNRPEYNPLTQRLIEHFPVNQSNKWIKQWEVVALTPAEIEHRFTDELYNLKNKFSAEVQQMLNAFARTRGYDDMSTACSYALSSNVVYKTEGQYCVDIRDQVWGKLFEILSDIASRRRIFTNKFSDIVQEFPKLSWPPIA